MKAFSAAFSAAASAASAAVFSDPDKVHDQKLAGVHIDPAVTEMKIRLRRLRTITESTANFYVEYLKKRKQEVEIALLLPEFAEWSNNELFCGSNGSSKQLHLDASRLAAIEELMLAERKAISSEVVTSLRDGVRTVSESLEGLYAFELCMVTASQALEAGTKALERCKRSSEAAAAEERKASALKDISKRGPAEAAAKKALEQAEADIAETRAGVERVEAERERLIREDLPTALETAAKVRRAAETGPIGGAVAALARAYGEFARGSSAVLQGGDNAAYNPTVLRTAPKETAARFAAYIVQWTLAKRRCKSSAALLEEFVKSRLETLLAPAKEAATLEALAAEVDDKAVKARIEAVRLPEGELGEACGACRTAVETLVDSLGACRTLFKARAAAAEEYEKREKDLKALQAKRDAVNHEVDKLEAQSGGHPGGSGVEMKISKKRIDLQALTEECERRAAALETAAAELEGFAAELASDQGERSVVALVGQPLSAFLAQYGAFCATRGRGSAMAGAHDDDHEDVFVDGPETVHTVVAPPPPPPPAPEPDSLIAFSNREEPLENPFGVPAPEPESLIAFSPPARSKPLDPFAAQPNPFAAQPDPFAAQPDPFAAPPAAAPPAAAPPLFEFL